LRAVSTLAEILDKGDTCMKKGRTLQEIAVEINRQNSVKKDYLADTPCLSLQHG